MLRFLTQKLKAQSLKDEPPFRTEEVYGSGTESDEENAEMQPLVHKRIKGIQEDSKNQDDNADLLIPARSSSSSPLSTRYPLQLISNQSPIAPPKISVKKYTPLQQKYTSPQEQLHQESSNFERCSSEYEPPSSVKFENHEAEPAVLNPQQACLHESGEPIPINESDKSLVKVTQQLTIGQREKRKWSKVSQRSSSCSDSSDDEEIKDLLTNQPLSPRLVLANVSPRKRHRLTSSSDDSEADVMQRPCLDFDKMQKTRKYVSSHGVKKARVIRIRGFTSGSNSGSTTTDNNSNEAEWSPMCDPAVIGFRLISDTSTYSPRLTPVEEPSCETPEDA